MVTMLNMVSSPAAAASTSSQTLSPGGGQGALEYAMPALVFANDAFRLMGLPAPDFMIGPVPIFWATNYNIASSDKALKFRARGDIFLAHQNGEDMEIAVTIGGRVAGDQLKLFALLMMVLQKKSAASTKYQSIDSKKYGAADIFSMLTKQTAMELVNGAATQVEARAQISSAYESFKSDPSITDKNSWDTDPEFEYHRTFPICTPVWYFTHMYVETVDISGNILADNVLNFSIMLRKYHRPPPLYEAYVATGNKESLEALKYLESEHIASTGKIPAVGIFGPYMKKAPPQSPLTYNAEEAAISNQFRYFSSVMMPPGQAAMSNTAWKVKFTKKGEQDPWDKKGMLMEWSINVVRTGLEMFGTALSYGMQTYCDSWLSSTIEYGAGIATLKPTQYTVAVDETRTALSQYTVDADKTNTALPQFFATPISDEVQVPSGNQQLFSNIATDPIVASDGAHLQMIEPTDYVDFIIQQSNVFEHEVGRATTLNYSLYDPYMKTDLTISTTLTTTIERDIDFHGKTLVRPYVVVEFGTKKEILCTKKLYVVYRNDHIGRAMVGSDRFIGFYVSAIKLVQNEDKIWKANITAHIVTYWTGATKDGTD